MFHSSSGIYRILVCWFGPAIVTKVYSLYYDDDDSNATKTSKEAYVKTTVDLLQDFTKIFSLFMYEWMNFYLCTYTVYNYLTKILSPLYLINIIDQEEKMMNLRYSIKNRPFVVTQICKIVSNKNNIFLNLKLLLFPSNYLTKISQCNLLCGHWIKCINCTYVLICWFWMFFFKSRQRRNSLSSVTMKFLIMIKHDVL